MLIHQIAYIIQQTRLLVLVSRLQGCPNMPVSVLLNYVHNKQLLKNHLRVMDELVDRDKNRASVLVWSVANEPRSQHDGADTYFSTVATHTKV